MEQIETAGCADPPIADALPPYDPPRVVTYRGAEILRMLGPVHACSFGHSVMNCGLGSPNFVAPWENRPAGAR